MREVQHIVCQQVLFLSISHKYSIHNEEVQHVPQYQNQKQLEPQCQHLYAKFIVFSYLNLMASLPTIVSKFLKGAFVFCWCWRFW
ncbi:hypothetical protein Lalb_Chr16g0388511 [Lupinus albus]|uniref:Uncharacterized protein n=1 Tax=Lupinus albus TaxID=3870 RepID=A0A6A4P4J5_LUPAL|nr:hypothetical protein Lalb_Chr16g0388511 [Lupinus albus]